MAGNCSSVEAVLKGYLVTSVRVYSLAWQLALLGLAIRIFGPRVG